MAVSDLVSVFFTWPLFATEGMLKADGSLITDIEVSVFFCKLGIYSRAVSYVVSVASLVLIAVDRFTAIAFPLKAVDITRRIRAFFLPLIKLSKQNGTLFVEPLRRARCCKSTVWLIVNLSHNVPKLANAQILADAFGSSATFLQPDATYETRRYTTSTTTVVVGQASVFWHPSTT
ncbi:hypothetical protein pdam_00014489 [Pocillopora damicornis]|uniref:G-protein coupled receptors family 1 profile domain-containing protein n=1 Tax=Pocillopora damicornis TaxID=46731 RepID=A0A3M6TZX9_POCDA|nr:hypothetical protein pdam_00014489 [Pocillopora damicornis]